jgi:CHASE2 domain-containing sensor protein
MNRKQLVSIVACIALLAFCLVVGYVLLAIAYRGDPLVPTIVGVVVLVILVALVRSTKRFVRLFEEESDGKDE